MVKSINVYFDDDEYEQLLKLKGEVSWHDFIWNNKKESHENQNQNTS